MTTAAAEKIPSPCSPAISARARRTLLNRILTEPHGKKFAVIVNEFGEIGIDNELVVGADEEVFEMNNGCICCTVRGDLIRIIEQLMKRKGKFDAIIVETTGLADPAPVPRPFSLIRTCRKRRGSTRSSPSPTPMADGAPQGRAGSQEPDRLRRCDPAQQDRSCDGGGAARGRGAHPAPSTPMRGF